MESITRPRLIVAALTIASSSTLSAAISFTENFSDNTAGPNMTLGANPGNTTTSFAGGNFAITGGAGRIYLGTNDCDYGTVDFTFQATVTNTGGAIAYFGMGDTTPATGANQFYEPLTGSNLIMVLRPDQHGRLESRDNATGAIGGTGWTNHGGSLAGAGTHLMKLTWTAATHSAVFQFDGDNDGSFEQSFTINDNSSFNASNSRLIIGGDSGLTFSNITVRRVPEPSTYGLIGAGARAGVAFVRRRRKHAGADA